MRVGILTVAASLALLFFAPSAQGYQNPQLGRFMQRDPAEYHDSASQYQYQNSDPVGHTDWRGTIVDGKTIKAGPACEYAGGFSWIDPGWTLVGLLPDTSVKTTIGVGQANPWALVARRYIELFKCCNPNLGRAAPFMLWGAPATAVGIVTLPGNSGLNPNIMQPYVDFDFTFTLPIAYGKGPPIGISFKFWEKSANPTWPANQSLAPGRVFWTTWEDQISPIPLVDHIQCCAGTWGGPGWPMPPRPAPPFIPALPPVKPVIPKW